MTLASLQTIQFAQKGYDFCVLVLFFFVFPFPLRYILQLPTNACWVTIELQFKGMS